MNSMDQSAPPSSLRPIFHPIQEHDQQRISPTPRPTEGGAVSAPPMASMYEEEPERTQVTTINVLRSEEAPVYDDTWVMVFGFLTDRSVLAAVLQEFQLCGTIVLWVTPPAANCNWIYIQFETSEGAQRALKRSGQRLGMLPMVIGVQPLSPDDRRFIAQQSGQSWTSKGMSASVPQRSFTLSSTTGKAAPVPMLLKPWTQRLSEVIFGS